MLNTAENIFLNLKEVFILIFDNECLDLNLSSNSSSIDGWDSLAHIRLTIAIENRFQIQFTTMEISQLQNVGDLTELISAKLNTSYK